MPTRVGILGFARARIIAGMHYGIALSYDQRRRKCDLAFDGRDFALDATLLTPVLISLGADRRARPDDVLPDAVTNDYAPQRLNARRGTPLDALDGTGQLFGSRWWLLLRRKQTEETRRLKESTTAEALAWVRQPVTITVRWVRQNVLSTLIQIGAMTLNLQSPVG